MPKFSKSGLEKKRYHHLKKYNRLKKKEQLYLAYSFYPLYFYSLYLLIKAITKETIAMLDSLFTMDYKKSPDFILMNTEFYYLMDHLSS